MKYRGQYFASSYQQKRKNYHSPGLSYLTNDSMTRWIIEKSNGLTTKGLFMISESVRVYAYLILSSQASARSSIIGSNASSLTAQKIFINNFEGCHQQTGRYSGRYRTFSKCVKLCFFKGGL